MSDSCPAFSGFEQHRLSVRGSAGARNDEPQLSGKIVGTAGKREERAIDVPASLNVFGSEDLAQSGVDSLDDLQYQTPDLSIGESRGNSRIAIRGIGTNISSGSQSVVVHLDGVYISNLGFATSEMFDIEWVGVLKGPEGTLYGRNATSGAINIISRSTLTTRGVDGYVGYGTNNPLTAEIDATVAHNDRGGLRLSANMPMTTAIPRTSVQSAAKSMRGIISAYAAMASTI